VIAWDAREERIRIRGLAEFDRGRLRAGHDAHGTRSRTDEQVMLDVAASALDVPHGPPGHPSSENCKS
jgi:hypothetical protein